MDIITVDKMAKQLGSTKEGVYARIRRGQLPKYMKIGGTICWRRIDWECWLEKQAECQGAMVARGDLSGAKAKDPDHKIVPIKRGPGRPRRGQDEG